MEYDAIRGMHLSNKDSGGVGCPRTPVRFANRRAPIRVTPNSRGFDALRMTPRLPPVAAEPRDEVLTDAMHASFAWRNITI